MSGSSAWKWYLNADIPEINEFLKGTRYLQWIFTVCELCSSLAVCPRLGNNFTKVDWITDDQGSHCQRRSDQLAQQLDCIMLQLDMVKQTTRARGNLF